MNNCKKALVLFLAACLAMTTCACASSAPGASSSLASGVSSESEAPSPAGDASSTAGSSAAPSEGGYKLNTSGKPITLGFTALNMNNPFYVTMLDAIRQEAAKENVTIIEHDGQMDPNKQANGMEDFISKEVDGIILIPVDSNAVVNYVEQCNQAGIPVISVDNNVAGGEIVSFVASNNYMGGELVGQYLADRLGGKGNICVIDYPLLEGCVQRVDGLMSVLKNYPDIKILSQQKGGDMTDGQRLGETWLQQFPEIDAIFGINDPNALGALTAAEAAGRDLFVVGIDGSEEGKAAMKNGRSFGATAAQDPSGMGVAALEAMIKHLNGVQVDKEIKIDTPLITVDDVK